MEINALLTELIKIVALLIVSGIGVIIKKYTIPAITRFMQSKDVTITKEQLEIIKVIVQDLVNSAYRLGLSEKVTDLKTYVMDTARAELQKLNIEISDELLDEIRRAAVVELEKSIKELENAVITGEVVELEAKNAE